MEAATVQAVMDDWRHAPIPARLRAALGLLEAMTLRAGELPEAELAACEAAGLAPEAIEDAANVGFHFNLINRAADAFDFTMPNEQQLPRVAKLLDRVGNVFSGRRPVPSHRVADDGVVRPVEVDEGRTHMLSVSGVTTPSLRRAVEGHVVRACGGGREAPPVPEALVVYLDKLARHAYRVVDEDIDALKAAGYGEEAIYELTVLGSAAAALVGLESVFKAMTRHEARASRAANPAPTPTMDPGKL